MKQGWEIKKLGEICEILDHLRVPITKKDRREGVYPYYGASGVQDYVDSYIFDGRYLLVGEDGAKWGANDKSAYIIEGKSWVNNHAHILKLNDIISDRLVEYYLVSKDLQEYITGAVVPKLTQQALRSIPIPVPPREEQERIVEILDREFERIDALKANAEQNLQHAKDLFQSALKQELQPKEGWETKTISEISENLDYKRVPVTKKDRKEGVYPYYGASGIVDYVDGYLFDEDLLLVSEDGANLLARSTPIAFSVSGKIWVNNHAHILRFENIELQKFVEYFFANYDISKYVTGAAQPKFNQKALNNIVVSYPTDIVEQRKVVSCLDKLKENYKKTIALCDDMKQALLRKAFNGEL